MEPTVWLISPFLEALFFFFPRDGVEVVTMCIWGSTCSDATDCSPITGFTVCDCLDECTTVGRRGSDDDDECLDA